MPRDAPARRVAREPYHRGVRQLFRRRDRLDHRLDTGRPRGRHVRAVADALAVLHDGAEACGDEAPAAPLTLAKRLRARADEFEAQPNTAGAAADLARLLAEQQRYVDAIEKRPVVLDACFPDARRRAEAAALAARHGAEFIFVHCDARPEQVEARLSRRSSRDGGPAGGWPAIARSVTAQWQTPSPGEAGRYVRIDTGRPKREWLAALGLDAKARP